jgi:hypothetical protein
LDSRAKPSERKAWTPKNESIGSTFRDISKGPTFVSLGGKSNHIRFEHLFSQHQTISGAAGSQIKTRM